MTDQDVAPQPAFDYGLLDLETDAFVRERVKKIKGLGNRASRCVIDIGRLLVEVKARLPHGYGGYMREAGLIMRQAKENGCPLQLVAGDGIANEDFGLIDGPASDGTLMTGVPDPNAHPSATEVLRGRTGPGNQSAFTAYATLQAWAQAVEKAGTFETEAVAGELRSREFDTVLGTIGFDDKGDVTGYDTFVWYQWRGGDYAPVKPAELTD
jgi:ABC-type branched-subunit amino acid transport system substrate-binding protein